jgi:hypothetical protein
MLLNQNPLLEVILVEKENKKRRVKEWQINYIF